MAPPFYQGPFLPLPFPFSRIIEHYLLRLQVPYLVIMAGSSTQAATLPKTAVASPKSPTPPKPPKSASSHPAAEAEGGEEQHPEEQHLEVDHVCCVACRRSSDANN